MERSRFSRSRICRFCHEKMTVQYKDASALRVFLTERGRIIPRRVSGNCMRHQRELTVEIKRARNIALLSFAEEHR